MTNIKKLEKELNNILKSSYLKLVNNNNKMARLATTYNLEVKKGFYEGKRESEGEFPNNRRPNEAFMKASEDIWRTTEKYLNKNELHCQESLRELFKTSREYGLLKYDMRIFMGHLIQKKTKKFFALFILYIPHDNPHHTKFNLPKPFRITLLPIN